METTLPIMAPARMFERAPMYTSSPTTAIGPIVTSAPRDAVRETTAVGWTPCADLGGLRSLAARENQRRGCFASMTHTDSRAERTAPGKTTMAPASLEIASGTDA